MRREWKKGEKRGGGRDGRRDFGKELEEKRFHEENKDQQKQQLVDRDFPFR